MSLIKFEDLLDTGAHFGHLTRKWHPNYKPYILMQRHCMLVLKESQITLDLSKDLLQERTR